MASVTRYKRSHPDVAEPPVSPRNTKAQKVHSIVNQLLKENRIQIKGTSFFAIRITYALHNIGMSEVGATCLQRILKVSNHIIPIVFTLDREYGNCDYLNGMEIAYIEITVPPASTKVGYLYQDYAGNKRIQFADDAFAIFHELNHTYHTLQNDSQILLRIKELSDSYTNGEEELAITGKFTDSKGCVHEDPICDAAYLKELALPLRACHSGILLEDAKSRLQLLREICSNDLIAEFLAQNFPVEFLKEINAIFFACYFHATKIVAHLTYELGISIDEISSSGETPFLLLLSNPVVSDEQLLHFIKRFCPNTTLGSMNKMSAYEFAKSKQRSEDVLKALRPPCTIELDNDHGK